jgi:shikimate kinase
MSTRVGADADEVGSRDHGARRGPRSLVLVGLPGAGKSTVGALVAARLGWPCIDLDQVIERRAGRTITELFAQEGEAAFRAWERRLTAEVAPADGAPVVLVPGGGWIEDPDHRARFGVSLQAVYLAVDPAVAVHRMGATIADRPLLRGPDAEGAVRELLRRRESLYLQSNHTVSTDSIGADAVAALIVALALGQRPD